MPLDSRFSYSNLSAEQRARLSRLVPSPEPKSPSFKPARKRYDSRASASQGLTSGLTKVAQQQAALLKYFKERPFDGVAATLTFRSARSPEYLTSEVAQAAIHELMKRLNKFVDRRGRNRALQVIAVQEGGTRAKDGTRLHYHLKIEIPPGMSGENFGKKVAQYWTQLRWASRDQNRVVPESDDGWLSYILKTRSKQDYANAIDWLNTQVSPLPTAECSGGG
ncbi:rolling circle replication-associated protein [Montanilutibacter psychrotolerans]|uniref:Replication-associated protein ORF2/G2P domain-containing protein n=1 Tax=Montanilutibacter psychrotolerans TaxID=1327343 RepID=A0A3M8SRC0_9GAMM|nr:hypothetical protein [Lysobacter psychrotolerans]RNF83867.1 hypothetical protein EER27_10960 [Lysobacter psychrotolerans]